MMHGAHLLGATGTLLAGASSVLAKIGEPPGPPPDKSFVVPYIIAAVLTVAVCYGAMKSSKRSHQD
ncbi:MAG: hypothetical protein OER86_03880 [Phycisphaerae bacterium]|nr:hypothetical protein [Phycisphaerae bacterium]